MEQSIVEITQKVLLLSMAAFSACLAYYSIKHTVDTKRLLDEESF